MNTVEKKIAFYWCVLALLGSVVIEYRHEIYELSIFVQYCYMLFLLGMLISIFNLFFLHDMLVAKIYVVAIAIGFSIFGYYHYYYYKLKQKPPEKIEESINNNARNDKTKNSFKKICKVKYKKAENIQIRSNCQKKNCGSDKTTRFKELVSDSQITVDFSQETIGRYTDGRIIHFFKVENYGKDRWVSENVIDKDSCTTVVK